MAKIPPGVGPRYPQVVVLVGGTGDLARRKLLPGLFHLASAGFIPGCRIIGVSLDDIDADAFRKIARDALNEFSARKIADADWVARTHGFNRFLSAQNEWSLLRRGGEREVVPACARFGMSVPVIFAAWPQKCRRTRASDIWRRCCRA